MTNDNDLIRRGDAVAILAKYGVQFDKTSTAFHSIAALPAVAAVKGGAT